MADIEAPVVVSSNKDKKKKKNSSQNRKEQETKEKLQPLKDRSWKTGNKKGENDENDENQEENTKDNLSWEEGGHFKPEDNPNGLVEESSFQVLFPQWRENYLRKMWSAITETLKNKEIKCVLNLVEGTMTVKTTPKTWDPYAIIQARDMIRLLSRGVDLHKAKRVLEDDIYTDVVKISSYVRNKERFLKRRHRLIGPDGSTLKAMELLTDCYVLVQGKTVSIIGPLLGIKQARRIVVDCMRNVHPIYHIKELMVKRELMKRSDLQDQNWEPYLPKFNKVRRPSEKHRQRKKELKKRKEKEYTPFPPPREPSKVDRQLETGEYFLSEDERKRQRQQAIFERQAEVSKENQRRKVAQMIGTPPPDDKAKKSKLNNNNSNNSNNNNNNNTDELINNIKKKTSSKKKKRNAQEAEISDYVEPSKKKRSKKK